LNDNLREIIFTGMSSIRSCLETALDGYEVEYCLIQVLHEIGEIEQVIRDEEARMKKANTYMTSIAIGLKAEAKEAIDKFKDSIKITLNNLKWGVKYKRDIERAKQIFASDLTNFLCNENFMEGA